MARRFIEGSAAIIGSVRIRLVSESIEQVVDRAVGELGSDIMHDLLDTMKSRMKFNIDQNRKIQISGASPSGYVPGALGRSIHYRVRVYNNKKGPKVRGFFDIGDGIPYAAVHDRDGETKIEAQNYPLLVFFNHVPSDGTKARWMTAKAVSRPGTPYFDDAVQYSLRKLGIR